LQKLVSSTDIISQKLDSLVANVSELEVEVNNSNNGFTMLAHTQFIENRTYTDDDRRIPQEPDDKVCFPSEPLCPLTHFKGSYLVNKFAFMEINA